MGRCPRALSLILVRPESESALLRGAGRVLSDLVRARALCGGGGSCPKKTDAERIRGREEGSKGGTAAHHPWKFSKGMMDGARSRESSRTPSHRQSKDDVHCLGQGKNTGRRENQFAEARRVRLDKRESTCPKSETCTQARESHRAALLFDSWKVCEETRERAWFAVWHSSNNFKLG